MSAWAKPGVKCVCVADTVAVIDDLGLPRFSKGQTFTIAFVEHDAKYGLFLGFEGVSRLNLGHIDGFRPLVTQSEDVALFRHILDGLPIGEPV